MRHEGLRWKLLNCLNLQEPGGQRMGRVFWAVLFWIWGFGGLVIFGIERFVVGDPADITSELFWIVAWCCLA
jgi:hypothetical protein